MWRILPLHSGSIRSGIQVEPAMRWARMDREYGEEEMAAPEVLGCSAALIVKQPWFSLLISQLNSDRLYCYLVGCSEGVQRSA